MEWPVSGGPVRGASCPLHRRSAKDAWELMRTKTTGKPPGAGAGRGGRSSLTSREEGRRGPRWREGGAWGWDPREGAPRPPSCHWPGSPGAGEGEEAALHWSGSPANPWRPGGGGDQAGGRACRAAERAASWATGPTPERPGAFAGLESERTSEHHPRPSAAFRLLWRRAEERARASPARPSLGLRAGTPRVTDPPESERNPFPSSEQP